VDQKPASSLKSFLGVPLKIGNRVIGYFELGSLDEGAFSNDDRRVLQVLAGQAAIAIENARLFENTQQTYYETIRSLAQALEARDAYTKGHSERVTRYALETARQMGLSDHSRKVIRYAGLLHDIGKIGISDSILHKRLKLTDEDWEAIRNHPLFGDSILGPLKFLQEAQAIVLRHHERYDGSGYPGHLKGDEIPLEARIIAVADAYDAMTSDRPYRQALDHQTATGELDKASGIQFDPAVVEAFLSVVDNVRVDFQPSGE
jgi:putative nucleotidyltransferase with HDIG domain